MPYNPDRMPKNVKNLQFELDRVSRDGHEARLGQSERILKDWEWQYRKAGDKDSAHKCMRTQWEMKQNKY